MVWQYIYNRYVKNLAHHECTKNIDERFHFILGLIGDGVITVHYCCNEEQLPDIFTKPWTIENIIWSEASLDYAYFNKGEVVSKVVASKFWWKILH